MRLTTIYRQLTQEQRVNFWTILTNLFVVLFTFWLGLSVQDMIATRHSELNERLAHYAYVDRFYNDMQNIENEYAYIITKVFDNVESEKVTENDVKNVSEFLKSNKTEVVHAAAAIDSTLRKFKYYCDNDEEFKKLTSITLAIPTYRFVLSVLESDSTISEKELRTIIQAKMCSKHNGLPIIARRKVLDEATDKVVSIFKKNKSEKEKDFYASILLNLVEETQNGYFFLKGKIQSVNKQPSFFKRLNFSWESIVLLVILIVLAFLISNVFVRFIAPKSIERNHSNEDFIRLKKENERLENIKATNKLYIKQLEDDIKSLKKEAVDSGCCRDRSN